MHPQLRIKRDSCVSCASYVPCAPSAWCDSYVSSAHFASWHWNGDRHRFSKNKTQRIVLTHLKSFWLWLHRLEAYCGPSAEARWSYLSSVVYSHWCGLLCFSSSSSTPSVWHGQREEEASRLSLTIDGLGNPKVSGGTASKNPELRIMCQHFVNFSNRLLKQLAPGRLGATDDRLVSSWIHCCVGRSECVAAMSAWTGVSKLLEEST